MKAAFGLSVLFLTVRGGRPTIVCRANRIPDEWYKD